MACAVAYGSARPDSTCRTNQSQQRLDGYGRVAGSFARTVCGDILDSLLALKAVREVSLLADPERPTEVSQRAWDAARSQSKRYADAPRAVRIAESIGRPWREILAIAHGPERRYLRRIQAPEEQDWITDKLIVAVLNVIAHRTGKDTITVYEFDDERELLLREDQARWRHGRKILIPNSTQICRAIANAGERDSGKRRRASSGKISMTGTWKLALEKAGLQPLSHPRRPIRSLSIPALLDRCYEVHGTEPTSREAIVFASANEIAYNQEHQDKPWQECVTEWKNARRAQGLPVPDRPPPRGQRPDYRRNMNAARPGEHYAGKWMRIENCIQRVIAFLDQLPPDQLPSTENYESWAKKNRAPGTPALLKHGGWLYVRNLAYEQMLEEPQTKPNKRQDPTPKKRSRSKPATEPLPARRRSEAPKIALGPADLIKITTPKRRQKP